MTPNLILLILVSDTHGFFHNNAVAANYVTLEFINYRDAHTGKGIRRRRIWTRGMDKKNVKDGGGGDLL